MDEMARIFRICVWFRPIQPPISAEAIASVVISVELSEWEVSKRIVIGGNFMNVDSSNAVIMEEPWSTSGNQKWNRTRPSFIAIAIVSKAHDVGRVSCVVSHCPVTHALVKLEKRTRKRFWNFQHCSYSKFCQTRC